MAGPFAADSAMTAFCNLPMDFRNSRVASRQLACVAQSGTSTTTLLGLRTTRRLPMALAISFSKTFSPRNTLFARSSPAISATRLVVLGAAASARARIAKRDPAAMARPLISEVLRKSRRVCCKTVFMAITFLISPTTNTGLSAVHRSQFATSTRCCHDITALPSSTRPRKCH